MRSGDEPLVVSEFGTWGLPDVGNLLDEGGHEPWWFVKHGEGVDLVGEAKGVLARFAGMRLDDVFGSWEGFVAESQLHQFEALKSEIEDIRSHEDIAGYVVTQLTDVHWESNGLLDMARNPKVFHHRMQQLNAADVLVGRPTRRRALAGDVVDIDVLLSHFSHRKIGACVLSWEAPELELRGELDVDAAFSPASVVRLPRIAIPVASDLPAAARLHVRLALRERFGRDVARGDVTLLALPDVRPAATFAVCADDAHLAGTLDARGWPKDDDGVIVARAWGQGHRSSRARRWARARVPLTRGSVRQAGRRGAPGPRPSVGGRLGRRDGVAQARAVRGPRHRSTRRHGVRRADTASRPGRRAPRRTGRRARRLLPRMGAPRVRTIVRRSFGDGRAIACTFPLAELYGQDPLATALLERLLSLLDPAAA